MALFGLTKEAKAFLERIEKKIDQAAETREVILRELIRLNHQAERTSCKMSEQLDQVNQSLSELEGAVNTLTSTVTTETEQVLAELERLRSENQAVDLGGVIARVQGLRTAVSDASANIGNIIADVQPEPTPGARRRR